jgi:hypothetical protein
VDIPRALRASRDEERMKTPAIPIAARRANRQRGNEIIEFAIYAVFMVPLFLWVFVTGMNLLRMIQTTQICRDIGNLYIHGVDFTTYPAQQITQRLAQGYGLNIGAGFSGGVTNMYNNDGNSGNGWVVLSEVMYVGAATCASLPVGTPCTNQNKYVYLQRIDFGNSSVQFNGSTVSSPIGTPSATINSSGLVQNYLTDPGAVAPNFGNFLQSPLADGQWIYAAETFFASPDLGISAYPAGGVYTRTFF